MKQIVITGTKTAKIIDVPKPSAKENWAVVKIISAPMCTEYKQYLSGKIEYPLGHEAAGEVVEVENSDRLKVGDRVVVMPQYSCGKCSLCKSGEYIHCENVINFQEYTGSRYGNSTYSEYILKPDWLLPKIPDGISYDHASMLCCGLGPTFGALQRMKVQTNSIVLITGLGPVGLGGIINAKKNNCHVVAVSKNKYRTKLALNLGAENVFNPEDKRLVEQIKEYTNGKGADVSLECAGNPAAEKLLINSTKRNGKVAFIGESGRLNINVSKDLIRKGLTLYGIWHYNYKGIEKLFEIVKNSYEELNKLITHTFKLNEYKTAWHLQLTGQCGKIILHP